MGKQQNKNPQSPPNEKLTSLGMEMERDLGTSDLTMKAQLDKLMDSVANTIPDKLSEDFYKEAKTEVDELISNHGNPVDTGIFRLALRKFSNIANRLVRTGGKVESK